MRVCVVGASGQAASVTGTLDAVAALLGGAGVVVERQQDCFPLPAEDLVVVFAPASYMPAVEGAAHPTGRQLARAVALLAEDPSRPSAFGLPVAEACAAALDVGLAGLRAARQAGLTAELLPLGVVPAWDGWGGEPARSRDVELVFAGVASDRRTRLLAGLGAQRETTLLLCEPGGLRPAPAAPAALLAQAELQLLVAEHADGAGFDWLTALPALLNGAVVVTERALGHDGLRAGGHLVSAPYERLGLAVDGLLADAAARDELRLAARSWLEEHRSAAATTAALQAAVERAGAADWGPDPRARAPRPRPVHPPPLRREGRTGDPQAAALKALVLQVRALARRIDQPARGEDRVERWRADGARAPRVSVVVSLFDYAEHVAGALASVARSTHDAFEVVVVDDASSDGSAQVARAALAAMDPIPTTLVAKAVNGGLPAARNTAVALARGELVFVLDADNEVHPRALERLEDALERTPGAAFAYGVLEAFGPAGPEGLMSFLPWDPDRLRRGNFVDAMALVRRSALLSAGGYTTDAELHGWEDFALWCALHQAGWSGVGVPEVLGRYRLGAGSMLTLTELDTGAAWAAMLRRFPFLAEG